MRLLTLAGMLLSLAPTSAQGQKSWKGIFHHGTPDHVAIGTHLPMSLEAEYRRSHELVLSGIAGLPPFRVRPRPPVTDGRLYLSELTKPRLRFLIEGTDVIAERSAHEGSGLDDFAVIPFGRPLHDRVGRFFSAVSNAKGLLRAGDRVLVGRLLNGGDMVEINVRHAYTTNDWRQLNLWLYDKEGRMTLDYKGPGESTTIEAHLNRQ